MYLKTDPTQGIVPAGAALGEAPNRGRYPPGGGLVFGPAPAGIDGFGLGLGECVPGACVPAPLILTPVQITRAVAGNPRFARLLGWRTLRDQIEVNLLGCPRANPRLAEADLRPSGRAFPT
jgi:hypothetical protein